MSAPPTLIGRSLQAMRWSYSGVAASVVLQVAASVLFARVLGAEITGLFAFGLLLFPPFKFLCEFGLGSALIEKSVIDRDDITAALSRSTLLALAMSAAWVLCIPVAVASMHQQTHAASLRWFALVILCLPLQSVCTALLTKRLEQKYIQISSLAAYALGYLGFGAWAALHAWGVSSLVFGFVVQNLIATLILVVHTRPPLRLGAVRGADSPWRFGAPATAINLSNWLTSSLDNMVIAWFFGARTLGVYSIAYSLVRTPADRIVTTLQAVLFPASVLARNDRQRLGKGSIATLDAVFTLAAPAFCSIACLSTTVVDALYGAAWREAARVLPPFALSMAFHCLTVVVSALLWGDGSVRRDLKVQWISAAALALAVLLMARISFVAVAWSVLPVTALRAAWGLRALAATLGTGGARILRSLQGGAMLSFAITPLLAGLDVWLRQSGAAPLMRLSFEATAGVLLWATAVAAFHRRLATPELLAGVDSMRNHLKVEKSLA